LRLSDGAMLSTAYLAPRIAGAIVAARELEVMKLVGATYWFIRWPFVIEGIVVGAAGALLAIAILGITKVALLDPLADHWTLIAAPRTIAFTALVGVLIGARVLVSAVGSGLSLRRVLRV
jgi:cell division transport system permease protein